MTEEEFRKLVREVIEELEEMSTTASAPGYSTPHAFTGNRKKNKERQKQTALKSTYQLVKSVESLDEAVSKYNRFKNDQEKTSKQKIGLSIREAKKAIKEIDRQLKILTKYKNEFKYGTDHYWKRTVKDIYTIERKILRISQRLRELKS
jgi:hypothetical protein